jgi:hypothetical protein
MAVVNVRDAVTEASLTIGQRAVACCVGLRARSDMTRRQLQAEEKKKTGPNVQRNPKSQAFYKEAGRLDEALKAMLELSNTIFNSVFVHRYKDSQETLRAQCTRHIGDWLSLDPARLFKDDYLKYLGWLFFDYSSVVRKEAVLSFKKLLQAEAYTDELSGFVERFIGRFVEIAVGDVEEEVALEMMKVMRDLQMKGMLDQVNEDSLDLLDEVIFDGGSGKRVRQEALAFLMDHTEGFEEDENDVDDGSENASGSQNKKGTQKDGEDETKAVAKRQKTAMQLETLCEFVEHHLYGEESRCALVTIDAKSSSSGGSNTMVKNPDLDRVEMMVNGIMRDWSSIISLLLRESDDLVSSALRPNLSAILLRIFVFSASNLKNWYAIVKATQLDEIDSGIKGKSKVRRASFTHRLDAKDQQKAEHWESLNEHLLKDLPTLLVRFRDDQSNLSALVGLLSCCDVSVSVKALKGLLKSASDLFQTSSDEVVIVELCKALREWMMSGGSSKGAVESSVTSILSGLWSKIEESLQSLKG